MNNSMHARTHAHMHAHLLKREKATNQVIDFMSSMEIHINKLDYHHLYFFTAACTFAVQNSTTKTATDSQ